MSRNIDHTAKFNELLEVNFKTYAEYTEAAEYLDAMRYFLHLNEILKIIKLDGFNSKHFKANCKFYRSYRLDILLSQPSTKLDAIKLLDKNDLLYLVDFDAQQHEETKIILDEYKALKNLGDLI